MAVASLVLDVDMDGHIRLQISTCLLMLVSSYIDAYLLVYFHMLVRLANVHLGTIVMKVASLVWKLARPFSYIIQLACSCS